MPASVSEADRLDRGSAMTWLAEHHLTWLVDGKRVPGRIAIGVPEPVPGGDGETICPVAIDGLQVVTRVRGEGEFHALLQGVHFLDRRIRDFVADGVRVVYPGDVEDPECATEGLLAMFRPF